MTERPPLHRVSADGLLGPFAAEDFLISTAPHDPDAAIPSALWYFVDEVIAVAKPGRVVASFTPGVTAPQDLAAWATTHSPGSPIDYPPLIWVAAPEVIHGARLAGDGSRLTARGETWAFDLVPKIPLNRSYYDASSTAFLSGREVSARGTAQHGRFVARTLWPEDFRVDATATSRPIAATPRAVRQLVREAPQGGAQSPFATFTLWERTPGARAWQDKPVLAVMLNGAQGDDDEAHGGHFALVTGRVGDRGAMGNWLANNFYTLDSYSEKGIVAAPTPLDNYLADLNSGQAWYRPSYLLVAILARERVATHVQSALARVYNQFYRHQLVYRHATMNCASISVDALRALGWRVPLRGATSRLLAAIGMPYFAVRERSIDKAIETYDYLTEDRTRLFPAAAFEDIGADLLRLVCGRRPHSAFERTLAEDLEALIFLRVPQLPSSRAWGNYPIVTAWEYSARMPSDPQERQIVPVPPRPFPRSMRDPDLLPPPRRRAEWALAVWAILSVVGIAWLLWRR